MSDRIQSLAALGLTALGGREAEITGLSVDSRTVEDGHLFAALPGSRIHGGEFIQFAVRMGAGAILTDREGAEIARAELSASDAALMLALAHVLESEGLTDRDFLARCTVGFERFRPYLMGDSDGTPKNPEWAAPLCGVPADSIRALARRMAQTRTLITVAWSLQRAEHGEQPYWMSAVLAAMLGQIGLPGGGVSCPRWRRANDRWRPGD